MALTSPLPGRGLAVLVALALLGSAASAPGCKPKTTEPPAPVATDGTEPEPAPAPEPAPQAAATPESLYAECRDRVENPQKDAECTADADCATAGCSNEVCTTAAEKANVMTTCEEKLCFKVLEACGCHEGECTWTLADAVPEDQVPAPGGSLPPSLPSTGMQPGGEAPSPQAEPAPAPDAPAPAEPAPAEPAPAPEPQ